MEALWLIALVLVPALFFTPGVMSNGYEVPKVTLYRSLVGLMAALWIIEWGLAFRPMGRYFPMVSWAEARATLSRHPARYVVIGACLVLVSNLLSTLLSPSIGVSLWGREPALDGYGFYNALSHFILFAVVATHLKTTGQLWRLLGAIVASGVVVGVYGILQYFGLDPFGVHIVGGRVGSTLGNPIFTAAFLLMVVPVTLAVLLRSDGSPASPVVTAIWVAALTVTLLTIVFTQSRGPFVGLAVSLSGFLVLILIALGWRTTLRAGILIAASVGITWAVVTFAPAPRSPASPASRAISIIPEVAGAFTPDAAAGALTPDAVAAALIAETQQPVSAPSGMKARLLLWEGAGRLVLHRPWFEFAEGPLPLSLHVFGYGPEFFQYLFPLEHPLELRDPQSHLYQYARDAHNNMVHRTVELGFFGLAGYLFLLGALAATAATLVIGRTAASVPNQKLVMAALLASLGGRTIEQMVGIPQLSDVALFWTLLAVVVALPGLNGSGLRRDREFGQAGGKIGSSSPRPIVGGTVLSLSMALVLASVVTVFTIIKNPYYALAESKATAADSTLKRGDLQRAMKQIDDAIALAPDIGRFHVTRAKVLDMARRSAVSQTARSLLAQEAYSANRRAVATNPFDIYSKLHFAESALTLAGLGQDGMGVEAIEEYGRLTLMLPRYWLSYFLLGRAHAEMGQPERAIEAYDEAIRLNPQYYLTYDQRGLVYTSRGQYQRAIEDYNKVIQLSPRLPSAYNHRGVAFYALGLLNDAIEDFDQAIRLNAQFAPAYNNRGTAYHELGQFERAIEDYDATILLNPQFAEAYANRALVYSLLKRDAEAKRDLDHALQLGFAPDFLEGDLELAKDRR